MGLLLYNFFFIPIKSTPLKAFRSFVVGNGIIYITDNVILNERDLSVERPWC
jgi:hypothetical protein